MLKAGQEFDEIADGYVIFITENDIYGDDEPIGRLMHDFRCVSAADMFYPELAGKVRELKEEVRIECAS